MSNDYLAPLIFSGLLLHHQKQAKLREEHEREVSRLKDDIAREKHRAFVKEQQAKKEAEAKKQEENRKYRSEKEAKEYNETSQRIERLRNTNGSLWTEDDLFWMLEKGKYYITGRSPDRDDIGIPTLSTSKDLVRVFNEGANPNVVSKDGEVLFSKILEFEDEELLAKAIEKSPDLGVVDKEGQTLLMQASSQGNMVALKMLAEAYPQNINDVNVNGYSALDNAVLSGWYEGAKYLLESGAKVNNDNDGFHRSTFRFYLEGISNTLMGFRGFDFKIDSLDDKIYKIPEMLIENGAEISKENVIEHFDRCMRRDSYKSHVAGKFLYDFMEKHDIEYPNPNDLLVYARKLDPSGEMTKALLANEKYEFGKEAYSRCGSLENICILLEKGVEPDYSTILAYGNGIIHGVSPIGSSVEELKKMNGEELKELFDKSKNIIDEHPMLKVLALKNMIDVYSATEEPEIKQGFKDDIVDIKRDRNAFKIKELKEAIDLSQSKGDNDVKYLRRTDAKTLIAHGVARFKDFINS